MTPYLKRRCQCAKTGRKDCTCPWHYKKTIDGHLYQGCTDVADRKLAGRLAVKMIENQIAARRGEAPPHDLGVTRGLKSSVLAAEFLKWIEDNQPRRRQPVGRVIAAWLAIVGPDTPVTAIGPFEINRWRSWRRRQDSQRGGKIKPQTINAECNSLRKMFTLGAEWHGTPHPFAAKPGKHGKVKQITDGIVDRGIRTLTREQVRLALDPATGLPAPYNLICATTLVALPRLSEVLGLTRHDVRIELIRGVRVGLLKRQLKGGKSLDVPIPLAVADALLAQLTAPGQHYLFPDFWTPTRDDPGPRRASDDLRRLFDAIPALAGLKVSHHWFRHTGITWLLEKKSPKTVAKMAGWSTTRMIDKYGDVTSLSLAEATASNAKELHAILTAPPDALPEPVVVPFLIGAGRE